MSPIQIFAAIFFVVLYVGIAFENRLGISKTAFALIGGALLWFLIAVAKTEHFEEHLAEAGADLFGLVIFLFAAMALVEILLHYRFFDLIRGKLFALKVSERKQLVIISVITFCLSAVIDNLTTTIVMTQIATKFFRGENLLRAVVGIVIAANAGGAFSPIGDVTTIMIWLAGKVDALGLIAEALLPAIAIAVVSTLLIGRKTVNSTVDATNEIITKLSNPEKLIVTFSLGSFALPLIASLLGLPPYIGLLFGLASVWMIIEFFEHRKPRRTGLASAIFDEFLKRTDVSSRMFFVGILLVVAALQTLGVLSFVSEALYGVDPSGMRMIVGNILLGVFSSIVDNVPLTAIAIDILATDSQSIWVLLALTVGTGGSLLVIGSAAGVVAMGMVRELTFGKYIQIGFMPALLGFCAGVGVWLMQYLLFYS